MWCKLFYTFCSLIFSLYVCPYLFVTLPTECRFGSVIMIGFGLILFIGFFVSWLQEFIVWKDI